MVGLVMYPTFRGETGMTRRITSIEERCDAKVIELQRSGGSAIRIEGAVIARNALGTWNLLVPTVVDDMPFVSCASYVLLTDAMRAAKDYCRGDDGETVHHTAAGPMPAEGSS